MVSTLTTFMDFGIDCDAFHRCLQLGTRELTVSSKPVTLPFIKHTQLTNRGTRGKSGENPALSRNGKGVSPMRA
jgi:hypothetical protein